MAQNKFPASFLVLFLSCILQYGMKALFGWSPDFVLGALITFSFFLGFMEIVCLGFVSAFILNWQPQFSPEILMLVLLPLAVAGIKKYFPWRIEINHFLSIFLALVIFYGVSNYGSFSGNPIFFLKNAAWALVFSASVFQMFNYFYKTKKF